MSGGILDLLLRWDRQFEGPRRASTTLRPQRIAYLIDPVDPSLALAAVGSATRQWGGMHQFLIPCPPNGEPSETWVGVLERHDPDLLIDLVGTSEAFREVQRHEFGRVTTRWARPLDRIYPGPASVFSALRRWQRLRPQGEDHEAIAFAPLAGHNLGLMLAFQYGNPTVPSVIEDEWRDLWAPYSSIGYSDFVRLRTIEPATLNSELLLELLVAIAPDVPSESSAFLGRPLQRWTLPTLTTIGLQGVEPSYGYFGSEGPAPEYRQDDEAYYRRVIIVGEPTSVPDLCLAWNLRAQRAWHHWFPIWISPEWSDNLAVRRHIGSRLQMAYPGLSEEHGQAGAAQFVSASLAQSQLESCIPDLVTISIRRAGS